MTNQGETTKMHLDALSKDSTFIFWRFKGSCLDIRVLISYNGAKISCGRQTYPNMAVNWLQGFSQVIRKMEPLLLQTQGFS